MDEYSSNTFTLAAPAVVAQLQIAIQPSRASPNTSTIASFKPSRMTYSMVVSKGGSAFSGVPPTPGEFTLQKEWSLLQRMGTTPTTKALKKALDTTEALKKATLTHSQRRAAKQEVKATSLVIRVNFPTNKGKGQATTP